MTTNRIFSILTVALLAGCSGETAKTARQEHEAASAIKDTNPLDPQTAAGQFEKIKSLVGQWYLVGGNQLGKELEPNLEEPFVTYDLTAGGHCVIEKLFAGQPKEMTTIYHLDGGQLVLAHYCSLGNQPHMVAVPGLENQISFELVEVDNLSSEDDLHISSHSPEFGPQDELTAHWAATRDQKPASKSLFRVKRK